MAFIILLLLCAGTILLITNRSRHKLTLVLGTSRTKLELPNRSSRCIVERSEPESAFWAVPKRIAKSSVVNDNSSIYYEIWDLLEFFVEFLFVCFEKHAALVVFWVFIWGPVHILIDLHHNHRYKYHHRKEHHHNN